MDSIRSLLFFCVAWERIIVWLWSMSGFIFERSELEYIEDLAMILGACFRTKFYHVNTRVPVLVLSLRLVYSKLFFFARKRKGMVGRSLEYIGWYHVGVGKTTWNISNHSIWGPDAPLSHYKALCTFLRSFMYVKVLWCIHWRCPLYFMVPSCGVAQALITCAAVGNNTCCCGGFSSTFSIF